MSRARALTAAAAALLAALPATPATATLPTPPLAAAPREAQPYLFHSGAGDIFEITTSMMAIQKSQNPDVRAYASTLIDHHTRSTNAALATAASAGVMPPPPELRADQKALITQLMAASPANFDRVYLSRQVPSHEQSLALQQGYAAGGDNPALRQTAQALVPVVQSHLERARQLLGSAR